MGVVLSPPSAHEINRDPFAPVVASKGPPAWSYFLGALPADRPEPTAAASSPMPLEARERAVGDYTDEAALRGMEKPKRICRECNSPVLPDASECPTCGSAL